MKRSCREVEAAAILNNMKYARTSSGNTTSTGARIFRESTTETKFFVVPHFVPHLETNTMKLVWEVVETVITRSAVMDMDL